MYTPVNLSTREKTNMRNTLKSKVQDKEISSRTLVSPARISHQPYRTDYHLDYKNRFCNFFFFFFFFFFFIIIFSDFCLFIILFLLTYLFIYLFIEFISTCDRIISHLSNSISANPYNLPTPSLQQPHNIFIFPQPFVYNISYRIS